MPTASKTMVAKLVSDAADLKKRVEKMKAHVDKHPASAFAGKVGDMETLYERELPQVLKFARDAKRDPAILPKEEDYEARRKIITKVIAAATKLERAVSKEVFEDADDVTEIQAFSAARRELVGSDAKLAQALIMVATGVKGRTGPKEAGVPKYNHIHIGGNAKYNLLFQPNTQIVLGTIDFHIDKNNNDQQKQAVKAVASRSGGKITLKVADKKVTT